MGVLEKILGIVFSPQFFGPIVFPGLVTVLVVLLTIIWVERKIAARIQMRVGPLYVLKPLGGAIQMLADGVRFLFQEFIIPESVDRLPFILAPVVAMTFAILPFAFIPVAPDFIPYSIPYSMPAFLGLNTIIPLTIIAMAWGSNNKFSIQGGIREAYMTIAYEAVLFIASLAMAMTYGTLDFAAMVEKQAVPGLLLNPFSAAVFFVAMIMSSGKLPFDIVEGEQEIVAGPFTEYSGIAFGLTMGIGYVQLYGFALAFTLMYLSGWEPLIPFLHGIYPALGGILLFVKAYLLMVFIVFLRSVYGRYRLDQAIRIGWRRLFPLSILSVFFAILLRVIGVV